MKKSGGFGLDDDDFEDDFQNLTDSYETEDGKIKFSNSDLESLANSIHSVHSVHSDDTLIYTTTEKNSEELHTNQQDAEQQPISDNFFEFMFGSENLETLKEYTTTLQAYTVNTPKEAVQDMLEDIAQLASQVRDLDLIASVRATVESSTDYITGTFFNTFVNCMGPQAKTPSDQAKLARISMLADAEFRRSEKEDEKAIRKVEGAVVSEDTRRFTEELAKKLKEDPEEDLGMNSGAVKGSLTMYENSKVKDKDNGKPLATTQRKSHQNKLGKL